MHRLSAYQQGLRRSLDILGQGPLIGRIVSDIDDQLRRHSHERHVIFYRLRPNGIFVVRVFPMARLKSYSIKNDLGLP